MVTTIVAPILIKLFVAFNEGITNKSMKTITSLPTKRNNSSKHS
jgi:hypothetical protein